MSLNNTWNSPTNTT